MEDYQKEKLSKLIVDLVKDKIYQPMKAKEMAALMGIPKAERAALQEVLDKLVATGKIGISQRPYGEFHTCRYRHGEPEGLRFRKSRRSRG